ncbi:MAG: transcriptional regulator [Ilumatobacteraceae bacterium]|nr:transcriptional regulator [Ilumatobacteraceae bacterium]
MSTPASDPKVAVPNRDDPRFHRLLEATRRAARNGYDAVSMRDLARETKMSLKTVYMFCNSKDQLIAEAHAEQMNDFRLLLNKRPPRGDTAEKRVRVVVRGIAGALERDEVLTRALMRAFYAGGAGVADARQGATDSYKRMIDAAIGADEVDDRADIIEILGHVINSVILNWLNNGWTAAHVTTVLDDTTRTLLRRR